MSLTQKLSSELSVSQTFPLGKCPPKCLLNTNPSGELSSYSTVVPEVDAREVQADGVVIRSFYGLRRKFLSSSGGGRHEREAMPSCYGQFDLWLRPFYLQP